MEWYFLILIGIAGGIIGGLGMGGGTLMIPMLTMIAGYAQLEAQAINLISFVPMAIISLIILKKGKLVKFKSLLVVAPLAIVGCIVGALTSSQISSSVLSKIFGGFILLIGSIFLFKLALSSITMVAMSHKPEKVVKKCKKAVKIDKKGQLR